MSTPRARTWWRVEILGTPGTIDIGRWQGNLFYFLKEALTQFRRDAIVSICWFTSEQAARKGQKE